MWAGVKLFLGRWMWPIIGAAWVGSLATCAALVWDYRDSKCKSNLMEVALTVSEKRNDIANNRPDDKQFLDELLTDPNW